MSKFRVNMVDADSGDILETMDEIFDNEEDAEEYACDCGGAFAEGAQVLSMSGRDYTDPDDVEFVVEEIDD